MDPRSHLQLSASQHLLMAHTVWRRTVYALPIAPVERHSVRTVPACRPCHIAKRRAAQSQQASTTDMTVVSLSSFIPPVVAEHFVRAEPTR